MRRANQTLFFSQLRLDIWATFTYMYCAYVHIRTGELPCPAFPATWACLGVRRRREGGANSFIGRSVFD